MIRVGFFTGKIYDETVDPNTIQECCRLLTSNEKDLVTDELKQKIKENCNECFGGCGMKPYSIFKKEF